LQIFKKSPAGALSCIKEGLAHTGGHQKDKCGLDFDELCRFKYLVNVGSNGYANKLK
jgi:protein glucosyltransferase